MATEDIELGTVVENYTAQDVEWKVFYVEEDETNENYGDIYLIASDYVPIANLPTTALLTTANTYNAYWSSSTLAFQTNSGSLSLGDTLTLFKGTDYDISSHSDNDNSKAVSTLLNTSNWTDFVDSNYADYAIGGPTLEMWVESWNAAYPSDPIWCSAGTGSGYYFGTGATTSTSSYFASLSSYEGYQNTLYYPHTSSYSNCGAYWLASPSALSSDDVVYVAYTGFVDRYGYSYANFGLRPLVHLKSGVSLQDNGTSYTLVN